MPQVTMINLMKLGSYLGVCFLSFALCMSFLKLNNMLFSATSCSLRKDICHSSVSLLELTNMLSIFIGMVSVTVGRDVNVTM